MKIRTGFVSNSSASSFCIFGAEFELSEFKDLVKKQIIEDDDDEETQREAAETWAEKNKLELFNEGYDSTIYIGRSWSTVKDNETGLEFKKSTIEKIQSRFPKKKCQTHEKAFSN